MNHKISCLVLLFANPLVPTFFLPIYTVHPSTLNTSLQTPFCLLIHHFLYFCFRVYSQNMGHDCHGIENKKSVAIVGLKILINQKLFQAKANPNNVSRFTRVKPIFHTNHTESSSNEQNSCFLKYCFLCNKTLRLDKQVYMYKYVL